MATHDDPRPATPSRRPRRVMRSALLTAAVVVAVVALLVAVLVGISMVAGPWFPKGGDGSMTTGAPETTQGPVVPPWQSDRRE
ncbi:MULTISPECIES: hypothetical protein [unclassified Knoellia]|uniref:hypothetical protein n=1 Tax=Knoellia altitudinis TaxID=3404795 RepID=UPI003610A0CA